jgi:magnesium chelatase family protein
VRSVLGELDPGRPLVAARPFRSPHHTVSMAGLVGGGSNLARPGEVSRSHQGVLFLDELAEFEARTLQALRQPLEEGSVAITRSAGSVRYPCRFLLVAATNPCPCGWSGDPIHACRCTPAAVDAYSRKLSGPLLDRIDLHVRVERLPLQTLTGEPTGEASEVVRGRVVAARDRQQARQGCLNAVLRPRELRRQGRLAPAARLALERWGERQGLTARGFQRACRVAATVADLDGSDVIEDRHAMEALGFRVGDAAAA